MSHLAKTVTTKTLPALGAAASIASHTRLRQIASAEEITRFASATADPMMESCRSNAPGERQLS